MNEKKTLMRYLLWAFALAWVLQVIASYLAAKGEQMAFTAIMVVTMLTPSAAALLSGAGVKTLGWRPQIRKNWKYIVLACVLPMALTILGAALYYLIVPAAFDLSGSYLIATVGEDAMAQLEAQGMTLPVYGIVSAIQSMILAPFVNMFPALGEEMGWRGVLYPQLKARLGSVRGRIVGGVIWGAWHWPVMILAGYEYGTDYWGAPVSGMVMFCIFAVACGVILDWLYDRSNCIWLPALAHGAVNAAGTVPLLFLSSAYTGNLLVGPVPIGIIAGIPMMIAALLLGRAGDHHPTAEA